LEKFQDASQYFKHNLRTKFTFLQQFSCLNKNMRLVQIKAVQRMFWTEEYRLLKIAPWVLRQASH
jgi:hypothetical protein